MGCGARLMQHHGLPEMVLEKKTRGIASRVATRQARCYEVVEAALPLMLATLDGPINHCDQELSPTLPTASPALPTALVITPIGEQLVSGTHIRLFFLDELPSGCRERFSMMRPPIRATLLTASATQRPTRPRKLQCDPRGTKQAQPSQPHWSSSPIREQLVSGTHFAADHSLHGRPHPIVKTFRISAMTDWPGMCAIIGGTSDLHTGGEFATRTGVGHPQRSLPQPPLL